MSENNFLSLFPPKFELPLHGVRCPKIDFDAKTKSQYGLASDATAEDFLQAVSNFGFRQKLEDFKKTGNLKEYKDRAKREFDVLNQLGFVDYILMIWDVVRYCKEVGIPTGPGRGSCAGSLLLYLIGVTHVDPVKYGLYFERFISATRAKKNVVDGVTYFDGSFLPDIDMDFCYYRRDEVIKYLEQKYPNRTSKILNTSTLSGKALIKDCGKVVAGKTEDEVNQVTAMIESKFGKVNEIDEEYKTNEDFRKWCDDNKTVYSVALKLKDLMRNKSVHASGNLVTYGPINDICPTEFTSDREKVCSFNKASAEKISLKLDILGLKSLSVIQDVCDQVGINYNDIDVEDYDTIYAHLQDLKHPHGIFQIEAFTNYNVCKMVKPKNLEQLSAVVAIARPGALAYADQYSKYANFGEKPEIDPIIEKTLAETGNVCLYQEQVIRMFNDIGFSLNDGDLIRRAIGKKKLKDIEEWKPKIYAKCKENNISVKTADLIWKICEDSAGYQFNKSHSVAYSKLSAITTYLKFNHPQQFFLALLRMAVNESDALEQIRVISHEMKEFKIELLPPHLSKSNIDFTIEGKNIRYGLSTIKGVSAKTLQNVVDFRDNQFENKIQCFDAIKEAGINIGAFSAMIQAGALDGFSKSRSRSVLEAQTYNILTDREKVMIRHLFASQKLDDILDCIKYLTEKSVNGDTEKPSIKKSRFETIKRKYDPFKKIFVLNSRNEDLANFWYEYSLLGNPYSQSLHTIYRAKNPKFTSISEIKKKRPGERVMLVGIVQECNKKTSMKGNRYVKIQILDETAGITALLFDGKDGNNIDRVCDENDGHLPKENDIVIISGKLKEADSIYIDDLGIQSNKIYCKLKDLRDSTEKVNI